MATAAKVTYPHIVKEAEYCGGKAAIDHTRVRVNNVVWLHLEGRTPAEILESYPDLNLAQIHAALTYYYDHTDEIDAELNREEQTAAVAVTDEWSWDSSRDESAINLPANPLKNRP